MGMQQMMMAAQSGGVVVPANIQLVNVWKTNFSATCLFPSGVQAGDLLIAFYSGGTSNAPPNDGFSWTRVAGFDNSKVNGVFEFYWRIATSSTPTSFNRTYSNQYYMVAAYRGVNQASPIDATQNGTDTVTNTLVTDSVTASKTKSKLICVFDCDQYGAVIGSVPLGMTQRGSNGAASPGDVMFGFDQDIASAGATGTRTAVISTFASGVSIAIALNNATT